MSGWNGGSDDLARGDAERGVRGVFRRGDPALVAGRRVEDGEERLTGRPVPVVGPAAALVPGVAGVGDVVIGLGIVGAVVAGVAEVLGVEADRSGMRTRLRWCWMPSDDGVHPGDQGAPGRRADRGVGEGVPEADALGRQPVEVRRLGERVAVAAEVRAVVLAGDPEDVRPIGRGGGRAAIAARSATDDQRSRTEHGRTLRAASGRGDLPLYGGGRRPSRAERRASWGLPRGAGRPILRGGPSRRGQPRPPIERHAHEPVFHAAERRGRIASLASPVRQGPRRRGGRGHRGAGLPPGSEPERQAPDRHDRRRRPGRAQPRAVRRRGHRRPLRRLRAGHRPRRRGPPAGRSG